MGGMTRRFSGVLLQQTMTFQTGRTVMEEVWRLCIWTLPP